MSPEFSSLPLGELFREVVDQVPDLFLVIDLDDTAVPGEIVFANEAVYRAHGRRYDQVIGRPISDLDDHAAAAQAADRLARLAAGEVLRFELRHVRADGTCFPAEVFARMIRFAGRRFAVSVVRETTELKRIEEELRLTRDELAQRVAERTAELAHEVEVRRKAEERLALGENMQALGKMASGVAHDFNNALSSVLGLCEILLDRRDLPAEVTGHLKTMRTAALDAGQTVRRLQHFGRTKPGGGETRQTVELSELAGEVAALTRYRWHDQSLRRGVVVHYENRNEGSCRVWANPSELREVMVNLVFNAIDAMPDGGTLTVRTGEVGGRAFVAVEDTGCGMDDATRRRCLEPFFTTKADTGTGLGLSTSWAIVHRHGGELEVSSEPGRGSAFTIWLPVAAVPKPREAATAVAEPTAALRVLVIDDNEAVGKAVVMQVNHLGHRAELAVGGRAGLERFAAASYDVVVTDLGMPGVDGRAVAAAVKASRPGTPVILLTGWGEEMMANGETPAGVDRVVAKPLTLASLRAVLAVVTSRSD